MGSIVGSIAGALVSSLVSSAFGGGKKEKSEAPAPAPVAPPPQAARAPEPAAVRQQNAALPGGPASTLLTGTGGVGKDQLNIGNTLLGS